MKYNFNYYIINNKYHFFRKANNIVSKCFNNSMVKSNKYFSEEIN